VSKTHPTCTFDYAPATFTIVKEPPNLLTITAEGEATGTAELQLSALLASVALGPVLPEDESTLYGVRGAMERAEKAAQS
jgi:hypothetical protein